MCVCVRITSMYVLVAFERATQINLTNVHVVVAILSFSLSSVFAHLTL